ncbi:hypothetical protein HXX76_010601 [Chlamydomonas incerta]|uniref:Protein kinase domain-containing protein n=1 Tax=Chlamydomonas incerta TaxID=51695 RepID=A0A835SMB3_CHLIN|nr:hypothetical protein HXX76_010601 [Chlamydomonas incerta]|eukprot:KAG2429817.1 hypothetical protein HXX76_010601 [Chlamydomonas incerta]
MGGGVRRPQRPLGAAAGLASAGLALPPRPPRAVPLSRLPAVRVTAGKKKGKKQQPKQRQTSSRPADSNGFVRRLARLADLGGGLGELPLPFMLPFGGGLLRGMGGGMGGPGVGLLEALLRQMWMHDSNMRVSPLHRAAEHGDTEAVARLLRKLRFLPAADGGDGGDSGDDDEDEDEDDEEGCGGEERRKAKSDAFAYMRMFAHPNAPDYEGETPLHWACRFAHPLLHEQGGRGRKAAGTNTRRVMQLLLSTGAHADAYSHEGRTPSMLVVENVKGGDAVGCLALLQCYGADMHVADLQGRTLLMRAAAAGNVEAARWLLRQGLDAGVVDKKGMRAAQHAHTKALRKELESAAASAGTGASSGSGGGGSTSNSLPASTAVQQHRRLELPPEGCPQLEPGELVWGRVLGRGAFAVVHEGTYRGQPVAIKVPNLHTEETPRTFKAHQQELWALARLAKAAAAGARHRGADGGGGNGFAAAAGGGGGGSGAVGSHLHVVEFKGLVSRRDGAQALVLGRCSEALGFESAAELSAEDRYRIAMQTAKVGPPSQWAHWLGGRRGLAFMHECGVVHGDFKIDNVLLDADRNVRVSEVKGPAGFLGTQ